MAGLEGTFDAIVVLGNKHTNIPRAEAAVGLYMDHVAPLIIASGGNVSRDVISNEDIALDTPGYDLKGRSPVPLIEAVSIQYYALKHGVDPSHIKKDSWSFNSITNAIGVHDITQFDPNVRKLAVITAVEAKRRILGIFEHLLPEYEIQTVGTPGSHRSATAERASQAFTDFLLRDIKRGDIEGARRKAMSRHPRHAGVMGAFMGNFVDPQVVPPIPVPESGSLV